MINNKKELIELLKNDCFDMFVAESIYGGATNVILVFENFVSFYIQNERVVLVGTNLIKLTYKEELLYLYKHTLNPKIIIYSDYHNVVRYEDELQVLLSAKNRKVKLKKLLYATI